MKTKNNPFKVPENYFDNLEKEILSKVNLAPKKQYFFSSPKQVFRYAAIVIILLGLAGIVWWNIPETKNNVEYAKVAKTKTLSENDEDLENIVSQPENEISANPQKMKTQSIENNYDLELSEDELEYLEYYLNDDILTDYLTYNDVNL